LEVVLVELSGAPPIALIGVDIPVTVGTTVRNLGPSSPIDAELEAEASPSAGASASPASSVAALPALTIGVPNTLVLQGFTISCDAPGKQEVVFDVEIRPANAEDSDPDTSNNTGQVSVTVECIMPIAINVRPGNKFNRINVDTNAVVPVAALTTAAGEYGLPLAFDAGLILSGSVKFGPAATVWGGAGGASPHNGLFHVLDSFELDDKSKDGDDDMRLGFRAVLTELVAGDTEGCMWGQYEEGGLVFSFFGCDVVDTGP
jgi:hypothetical protein